MLHLSDQLGQKSPAEAAKWFGRAAEQGIASAQFNLGILYKRGEGVAQNDKQAFFWFQSAAEQNFPQAAQPRHGICRRQGYSDELSESSRLVREVC